MVDLIFQICQYINEMGCFSFVANLPKVMLFHRPVVQVHWPHSWKMIGQMIGSACTESYKVTIM